MNTEPIDLAFLDFRDQRANVISEDMRVRLAKVFGVTVQGPHLTLRWADKDGALIQASFVCVSLHSDAIREDK